MRHIRRWGAVYVLLILFVGSWVGQFFAQLAEFRNEQQEHGAAFAWSDFLPTVLASTLENWQSEWLQLVFQAVLLLGAKHLLFQVDAQDLERLERKVDEVSFVVGARRTEPTEREEPGDPSAIGDEPAS